MAPELQITFLGTGTSQGVPVIACPCAICKSLDPRDVRMRSSVMIESEGKRVVIDTGPDFRQQMLVHQVKSIDGIVFTHEHKDHIAGLDEVRAFNYFNQWRAQVYCTSKVEEALKREFAYAFAETKYPGIPEIDLNIIENRPFEVAGLPFCPIEVRHMFMPVFGYRVGNFSYITDANYISDDEKAKLQGTDVLVLNALRIEKHPSHFTLDEAIELAHEIGARVTYFTHISHQLGSHEAVEQNLPEGMRLAYDGLVVHCN